MKLYIKNMVCDRCITIVKAELDRLNVDYYSVELGEVTIKKKLTLDQLGKLITALKHYGFQLIDNTKNDLIEKLKWAIADLEHNSDEDLKTNFSDYISLSVHDNFISLNTLLAEIKGISIEKYIIKQKIELIKELLLNKALNLNEIALKMHYSDVTQLSKQFKCITGLTPSHFRRLQQIESKNPEKN
jgi:AraC-like DNA-binding protein